jgi:hypothetical protein
MKAQKIDVEQHVDVEAKNSTYDLCDQIIYDDLSEINRCL